MSKQSKQLAARTCLEVIVVTVDHMIASHCGHGWPPICQPTVRDKSRYVKRHSRPWEKSVDQNWGWSMMKGAKRPRSWRNSTISRGNCRGPLIGFPNGSGILVIPMTVPERILKDNPTNWCPVHACLSEVQGGEDAQVALFLLVIFSQKSPIISGFLAAEKDLRHEIWGILCVFATLYLAGVAVLSEHANIKIKETTHFFFCVWVCTLKQSCLHKKKYQRNAEWERKTGCPPHTPTCLLAPHPHARLSMGLKSETQV